MASVPYASIIVPTHDRACTLPLAVASIQAQTIRDIEIIIAGDGVDAPTRTAALSLAAADPRIVFLDLPKAPRSGIANRDRAVLAAASPRIFYMDDDDLLLPRHVEALGQSLEDGDIAESLPASLSRSGRIEVALANHGRRELRSLLAARRLKLTYDTHIAHRAETYRALGRPWISQSGDVAEAFLAAFAANPRVRWRSRAEVTALSIHGAARRLLSGPVRAAELAAVGGRLEQPVLPQAEFVWYLFFTWLRVPAVLDLGRPMESLARIGISFNPLSNLSEPALLLHLSEPARRNIEVLFKLLRGDASPGPEALTQMAVRLCENLGGAKPLEANAANMLRRAIGLDAATAVLDRNVMESAFDVELAVYLGAELAMMAGRPDEALRRLMAFTRPEPHLPDHLHEKKAVLLNRLGRHGEAVEEARAAIAIVERSPAAHEALLGALASLGRSAAARRALEAARAVLPDSDFVRKWEVQLRQVASHRRG